MAKRVSWYDQGLADGEQGMCDAPYEPGNRHHAAYMEGYADGEAALERARQQGDYYGARNTEDEDDDA